jgi:hypothetical protein
LVEVKNKKLIRLENEIEEIEKGWIKVESESLLNKYPSEKV